MIYLYQHPETEEVVEVVQSMHDEHVFVDESGVSWTRIFTAPSVSVKDRIDPYNTNEFLHLTKQKRGSVGDIMEKSAELSEQRKAENNGKDPVQTKFFNDYHKKNNVAHMKDPDKASKPRLNKPKLQNSKKQV